MAFDNTASITTGVAISSLALQTMNVSYLIRDDNGKQVGGNSFPLVGSGHKSFILASQFPATAGIRGTIELSTATGGQISVIGIRSPATGTFTTLPPLSK